MSRNPTHIRLTSNISAMDTELEDVKKKFIGVMMTVHPDIMPDFMWWLDYKQAEYKVYGHLLLTGADQQRSPHRSFHNHHQRSAQNQEQTPRHANQTALIPLQNVQKFVSLSSSAKRKQISPCRRVPFDRGDHAVKLESVITVPQVKALNYSLAHNDVAYVQTAATSDNEVTCLSDVKQEDDSKSYPGSSFRREQKSRQRTLPRALKDYETTFGDVGEMSEINIKSEYFDGDTALMDLRDKVVMKSSGRGRKIPFDTSGSLDPERNGIGFKCAICGAILQYKSGLNRHILRHTACKDFQCTLCHKLFHRKDNLVIHYKKVHCKVSLYKHDLLPATRDDNGGGQSIEVLEAESKFTAETDMDQSASAVNELTPGSGRREETAVAERLSATANSAVSTRHSDYEDVSEGAIESSPPSRAVGSQPSVTSTITASTAEAVALPTTRSIIASESGCAMSESISTAETTVPIFTASRSRRSTNSHEEDAAIPVIDLEEEQDDDDDDVDDSMPNKRVKLEKSASEDDNLDI